MTSWWHDLLRANLRGCKGNGWSKRYSFLVPWRFAASSGNGFGFYQARKTCWQALDASNRTVILRKQMETGRKFSICMIHNGRSTFCHNAAKRHSILRQDFIREQWQRTFDSSIDPIAHTNKTSKG